MPHSLAADGVMQSGGVADSGAVLYNLHSLLPSRAALHSLLPSRSSSGSGARAMRTVAVAATGPARSVSGGSHTPDPRHVQRWTTCTAIGHPPGSPDLHGTKGNVRWTGLGRPVAVAAAVPQRDVRGGTRWSDMFSASTPLKTTALFQPLPALAPFPIE